MLKVVVKISKVEAKYKLYKATKRDMPPKIFHYNDFRWKKFKISQSLYYRA